ncbi:MAG: tRNA (guanosine(46)-N7)-methyltransferase TrmB [Xanthomonadales bacterium]|nr:tRNA (guanosine(46)-N7)-methyltransferase TrmB [Xanthomonadales bacterium]NIX12151.1 tRNA (guanosine(46)-N7)-methyltransferase TrmB [Xanthomonadales bacterium]
MSRTGEPGKYLRPVRSYVLRKGRLTPAQQRALEELWPEFGIKPGDRPVESAELFGREAPLIVEIGFGNGEATWRMARNEADFDFIGIEVHEPGVGHLLQALKAQQVANVRIAKTDAVEFMHERLHDGSLSGVRIWFPDPWPKKRHHKRRIVQAEFVDLLARKMKTGAVLHLATDWQPYAEHMLEVMRATADFENLSPAGDYCERPDWRPVTKFEKRGDRLGHETRDLLFRRTG